MTNRMPATETTIVRAVPPAIVMKLVNPLVAFLVSRGWTRASDALMILHWTGRRSGRAYSTPVSRMEVDGVVFTTTTAAYRLNFAGGRAVELVLDGDRSRFTGTLVDDPEQIAVRLRAFLDAQGFEGKGRAFGAKITGDPTVEELAAYVTDVGTVIIEFTPA